MSLFLQLAAQLKKRGLLRYARNDSGEHWLTIGAHRGPDGEKKGGVPVKISGGKIVSGPKHLKGKTLKGLGKVKPHAELNRAIHKAHKEHGFAKQDIHDAVEFVHGERKRIHDEREKAKEHARKLTGLTAGDISRLANAGHDYASGAKAGGITGERLRHFDEFAQEMARDFPELGLGDPDDPRGNFAANLWDALAEGKREAPAKHHEDTIDEAIRLLHANRRYQPSEDLDAVPFRKARVNMLAVRFQRALHPRAKIGYCRSRCACFFGRCTCGCRPRHKNDAPGLH